MRISSPRRRGTILPMLAITCFSLFAFIALAVDLGMLMVARTECQNAADAAALAGARTLDNDVPVGVSEVSYNNKRPEAITVATAAVKGNYLLQSTFAFNDSSVDKVEIGIYDYNAGAQVFQPTFHAANAADPTAKINGRPWTAVRVTVKGDQPTYFARIFGVASMPMLARATAAHRPRDIAMVLDYSGSMKFGCVSQYPPGTAGSTGTVIGWLNPDPRIPQFGHYQRYDSRQTSNPNGTNQHPLRTTGIYTASSGEIFSPNNQTYESTGGPPMVEDFYTLPGGTATSVVNPAALVKGFQSPGTVLPYSSNYNTQNIALGSIVGDRFPRKGGVRSATADWDATRNDGAARNVAEILYANGSNPSSPSERNIPVTRPAIAASGNSKEGSNSWRSFYDDGWERNGYDLNIPAYIASNYSLATQRIDGERFQGYVMGPGYWGKTFFVWPPDPREDWDWRRKFFLKGNGAQFDPQVDNINGLLLDTTNGGHVLNDTTSNYRVNYPAILAWLKDNEQTLPANLRAGRILFYATIPNDCTSPGNDDERFWREYIDFVLGTEKNRTWYDARYCLAGVEGALGDAWGSKFSHNSPLGYTPSGSTTPNPKPYMCYTDCVNMPRAHFWFGPASMLNFIATRGQFSGSREWNWNPGTVREAQSWQLKAAIQSSLDDIRKNHPNDQVGMSFFAYSNFRTPRTGMGQDWDRLKASLFFPNTFLNDVVAGNPREERPYNSSFSSRLVGNLPNAQGGTDPNNGLALAYNMFGDSSSGASGAGGRRGATKIVIFETDGVPNSYQNWDYISAGLASKYNWIDNGSGNGNGDSTSMNEAYSIVQQICAATTSGNPGYSLPNSPARVYPIGFGDLFSSTSSFLPTARTFLQTIAYRGKTSDSISTPLPTDQIITGDYNTRISNLRSGLERMLQNGVQVTLIE